MFLNFFSYCFFFLNFFQREMSRLSVSYCVFGEIIIHILCKCRQVSVFGLWFVYALFSLHMYVNRIISENAPLFLFKYVFSSFRRFYFNRYYKFKKLQQIIERSSFENIQDYSKVRPGFTQIIILFQCFFFWCWCLVIKHTTFIHIFIFYLIV